MQDKEEGLEMLSKKEQIAVSQQILDLSAQILQLQAEFEEAKRSNEKNKKNFAEYLSLKRTDLEFIIKKTFENFCESSSLEEKQEFIDCLGV
jgi:hypothetical protein